VLADDTAVVVVSGDEREGELAAFSSVDSSSKDQINSVLG
jgi:hypothetical protein